MSLAIHCVLGLGSGALSTFFFHLVIVMPLSTWLLVDLLKEYQKKECKGLIDYPWGSHQQMLCPEMKEMRKMIRGKLFI